MGKKRVKYDPPYEMVRLRRDGQIHMAARTTCQSCGGHKVISLVHHLPRLVVIEKFVKMGWKVKGNYSHLVCPLCQTKVKESAPMSKIKETVELPKPATIKQMREVINALEMYFDASAGSYSGEYTDRKLADELEIAMAIVTNVRREAYGDLKVSPEIRRLDEDMGGMLSKIGKTAAQIGQLGKDFESYQAQVKKSSLALGEIQGEVANLKRRLAEVSSAR